jgi:hypothetical protein
MRCDRTAPLWGLQIRLKALPLRESEENSSRALVEALHPVSPVRLVRLAPAPYKPKRTMSASARRKIAAAQRARWAKVKKGEEGGAVPVGRAQYLLAVGAP